MSRATRLVPNQIAEGWPDRPSSDVPAEAARRFALNLRDALDGRTTRAGADLTGVSHVTIGRVLNGTVWPDAATIARLEHGLGRRLWPTIPLQ